MALVRRSPRPAPTTAVKVEDYALAATTEQEQRFAALYELLFPRLIDFAERFLGHDAARDAVHEAICDIWLRRPLEAVERPSVAFFFRAVRNQIAVTRRRRYREELRLTRFLYELARRSRSAVVPDAALERAELAAVIEATVAAMPDRCREVWVLVREVELTYAQAAESLGLSLKTAKQHMTRAQALLREALVDAGYRESVKIAAGSRKLLPGTAAEEAAHD